MNWIESHQLLICSAFSVMLFLGADIKIGEHWADIMEECHDAPTQGVKDFYCAAQSLMLFGLVVSVVILIWRLI